MSVHTGVVVLCLLLAPLQTVATRAPLVAREDFRETPPAEPITQSHVANADLELLLLGPGAQQIKKSHHDQPADDPYYVWSGDAKGTWAVALQHRAGALDLSRGGAIRWRSRQSGFRQLHPIVRLADGRWLVADQAQPASDEWQVQQFALADLTWRALNPATITEEQPINHPSLGRVTAVGCTDLMPGGSSPASSRLDWIEIYGSAAGK